MKRCIPYTFGLSLLMTSLAAFAVPASVGLVDFAKGRVSAQHPNMGSRGLATKANIYGQDLVETGDQSFSVLRFKDNNKVTVRPLSRFAVSSAATVRLDQGSLNVESGASRMTVKTKDAKIEARQAKLEIRVCKQDCTVTTKDTKVVAKVVSKRGQIRAVGKAGNRALVEGSPLYETDRLISGSKSEMLAVFRDGGRVSLGADTEVNIKEFRYGQKAKDSSTLQLVKGSLRAMTGQIGKSVPENYSIQTPVATMGVRGTSFDLVYPVNAKGQRGAGKGLLAQVRQGRITQRNAAGTFTLNAGKTNFIGSQQQAPTGLAAMPAASQHALGKKPEEVKANLQQLFGTQGTARLSSGTYVHVESGQVTFISESGVDKGKRLVLGKGQSAFVDENGTMQLLDAPIQDKPGTPGSALAAGAQSGEYEGVAGIPGLDDKSVIADRTADDIMEAVPVNEEPIARHFPGKITALSHDGSLIESIEHQGSLKDTQTIVHNAPGGPTINLTHDASNFDYMSWGKWTGVVEGIDTFTQGHFIEGLTTETVNMPKNGTATYVGNIRGDYIENSNFHDDLSGNVTLDADFGTMKIDGHFQFSGTNINGYADMIGADIVGHEIENGQLNGNITGTSGSGFATGRFYGPTANEVGGAFEFSTPNHSVVGVYGAKR